MAAVILAKAIVPTAISTRTYNANILNAMIAESKNVKKTMELTTATWKHKPRFDVEIQYRGGEALLVVDTPDKIWNYLDLGTRRRYAVMSNPFEPKTVPNLIGSRAGTGKKVGMLRNPITPGIRARHFSYNIRLLHEREFAKAINNAIAKSLASPQGLFR